jgi:hypothetical protein
MEYKTLVTWIISIAIVIMIVIRYVYVNALESTECSSLNIPMSNKLSSLNPSSPESSYTLRDYYCKSAYNSCSPSGFKNNYVSTCALNDALDAGFRCLDFEIYSVNDKPVVATSTMENVFDEKETFNSLQFSKIMEILDEKAFTNTSDPLIIHLRIKSKNDIMLNNLASIFSIYNQRFLGPSYSFQFNGKDVFNEPILNLRGKIVLVVSRTSDEVQNNNALQEYVNASSMTINARLLKYKKDVVYSSNMNELIEYNKRNVSFCYPDTYDVIPSLDISNKFGIQYTMFSLGKNLNTMSGHFDKTGFYFVLKPEELRYKPVTVTITPQKESLSYAPRVIQSNYYKFSI